MDVLHRCRVLCSRPHNGVRSAPAALPARVGQPRAACSTECKLPNGAPVRPPYPHDDGHRGTARAIRLKFCGDLWSARGSRAKSIGARRWPISLEHRSAFAARPRAERCEAGRPALRSITYIASGGCPPVWVQPCSQAALKRTTARSRAPRARCPAREPCADPIPARSRRRAQERRRARREAHKVKAAGAKP